MRAWAEEENLYTMETLEDEHQTCYTIIRHIGHTDMLIRPFNFVEKIEDQGMMETSQVRSHFCELRESIQFKSSFYIKSKLYSRLYD